MIGVIIASRKVGINPDNVATPIAASLGDLITLALLAGISTGLYKELGEWMPQFFGWALWEHCRNRISTVSAFCDPSAGRYMSRRPKSCRFSFIIAYNLWTQWSRHVILFPLFSLRKSRYTDLSWQHFCILKINFCMSKLKISKLNIFFNKPHHATSFALQRNFHSHNHNHRINSHKPTLRQPLTNTIIVDKLPITVLNSPTAIKKSYYSYSFYPALQS